MTYILIHFKFLSVLISSTTFILLTNGDLCFPLWRTFSCGPSEDTTTIIRHRVIPNTDVPTHIHIHLYVQKFEIHKSNAWIKWSDMHKVWSFVFSVCRCLSNCLYHLSYSSRLYMDILFRGSLFTFYIVIFFDIGYYKILTSFWTQESYSCVSYGPLLIQILYLFTVDLHRVILPSCSFYFKNFC